jgi:hypothetical protein
MFSRMPFLYSPSGQEGGAVAVNVRTGYRLSCRAPPAAASATAPGHANISVHGRRCKFAAALQNCEPLNSPLHIGDLADRGYVLETGQLVLDDDARDLAANEEVKAAYLGGHARK